MLVGQTEREQKVKELTSYILHKHYCENDMEAVIAMFDDRLSWFGAEEQEYAVGAQEVAALFRGFEMRRCSIEHEKYDVVEITPDVHLCTGQVQITTSPETGILIRMQQRVTMCFRWVGHQARCCHMHVSNPYREMIEEEIGFPTSASQQNREYRDEQLDVHKKQLAERTAELISIYNTVPCAILRLRRNGENYRLLSFNQALVNMLEVPEEEIRQRDWSQGFSDEVDRQDVPWLRDTLRRLEKPGDRTYLDYRMHSRSGKCIYLSCSNALIDEQVDGQTIQRITFDISKRIELESVLKRMSFEDFPTGLFNRNRFNRDMELCQMGDMTRLGVACFDLNCLKEWNDRMGHSAGDDLIYRTARHIYNAFPKKAYRIGGDEFVVIQANVAQDAFCRAIDQVVKTMQEDGISISAGRSWRALNCSIREQFDEADRQMYQVKTRFYRTRSTQRDR